MTLKDIKAALRNGKYAWPGGYPLYFVCTDGAVLSFEAVRAEWRQVVASVLAYRGGSTDWHVTMVETNWENPTLHCEHTGERIESAYAED